MMLAQIVSAGDRIDAVHTHFRDRTSADGLNVVFAALAVALLLCGLLLVVGRIQLVRQRREEQARDERRRNLTGSADLGQQQTPTLTLLKKQPAARGR